MSENNQKHLLLLFSQQVMDGMCRANALASAPTTPIIKPEHPLVAVARKLKDEKKYGKQLSQWTGTKDDLNLDSISLEPTAHVVTKEEIYINLKNADIRDRGAYADAYGPSAYFKKIANPDCP